MYIKYVVCVYVYMYICDCVCVCRCVYMRSLNVIVGCLAGRVNKTVLYDNGGLRFVLYGDGCESRTNRSTVTIILLCWQGSDMGRPELFSRVGTNDRTFYQTFVHYVSLAAFVQEVLVHCCPRDCCFA